MEGWSRFTDVYDALKAGSIDGTDTEPHDHAIVRAIKAKYVPDPKIEGEAQNTLFVGRLAQSVSEEELHELFKTFGRIRSFRLVRDVVTGFPRGYGFVEYEKSSSARTAYREANRRIIDGKEIIVEYEAGRKMPGWVPRRLGGGFGGRKESGQLRFGGRERPFRKPLNFSLKKPLGGSTVPPSGYNHGQSDRGHDHLERGLEQSDRSYSPERRNKVNAEPGGSSRSYKRSDVHAGRGFREDVSRRRSRSWSRERGLKEKWPRKRSRNRSREKPVECERNMVDRVKYQRDQLSVRSRTSDHIGDKTREKTRHSNSRSPVRSNVKRRKDHSCDSVQEKLWPGKSDKRFGGHRDSKSRTNSDSTTPKERKYPNISSQKEASLKDRSGERREEIRSRTRRSQSRSPSCRKRSPTPGRHMERAYSCLRHFTDDERSHDGVRRSRCRSPSSQADKRQDLPSASRAQDSKEYIGRSERNSPSLSGFSANFKKTENRRDESVPVPRDMSRKRDYSPGEYSSDDEKVKDGILRDGESVSENSDGVKIVKRKHKTGKRSKKSRSRSRSNDRSSKKHSKKKKKKRTQEA